MEQEFVLWVQNKGCTPAIASGVEICAAALVRQCQVFNAIPNEPNTFFETLPNGSQSACPALGFKLIPMGEYFWPLERLRVISALQRGDFSEAQIWLKPHQIRYKVLYKLAGFLSLYTNWETDNFVRMLGNWLRSNDLAQVVPQEQINIWQTQLHQMRDNELQKAWESTFLIELPLLRKNYTLAFIQFAQTLERLLSIQYSANNWVSKGFITPPPHLIHLGNTYQPGFKELIEGWCKFKNLYRDNKWYKLLYRIREKRNQVIHSGEFVTWDQMRSLWTTGNLFSLPATEDPLAVKNLMLDVLKQVSAAANSKQLLVRSLFEWGLNYINDVA